MLFLLNPGYFYSQLHLSVLDYVDHNFAIIWPIWVVLKLFCDFASLDLYGQSFMEFCDTVPNFHYLLFTIPWTICVLQSPVIVTQAFRPTLFSRYGQCSLIGTWDTTIHSGTDPVTEQTFTPMQVFRQFRIKVSTSGFCVLNYTLRRVARSCFRHTHCNRYSTDTRVTFGLSLGSAVY